MRIWLFLICVVLGASLIRSDKLMPIQKYNRLGETKSPYLLQHKNNPVHWFPWGEEAFEAARTENKPIFLSIGYSTCYWCHMMEKDSFEIQAVADALNRDFISIKVDREEHPDVDQIYMDAVIGLTGRGGWPMSVFLTPDLKPFFGGTFFWRAQFFEILDQVQTAWKKEPQKILESGKGITGYLEQKNATIKSQKISLDLIQKAYHQLEQNFDSVHGGFGPAPKFPHSLNISLLLRIHGRTGEKRPLEIATKSLDGMAHGEIYDRIGGGFHRYATREDWNEPHYEKMLYDNALLTWTYLEAYQITQNKTYAEIVRETFDYILREMTDPEGGFYSAQDAGEVGKEGKYYHLNKEERLKHEPPQKDDKILTSWNGLMIASLAKGYQVLGEKRYREAAQKGADFIRKKMFQDGKLLRRYRDGESRFSGTLEDYAFLIDGLLSLYESDFDPAWIHWAQELQKRQDDLLWDMAGGYFFSDPKDPSLIIKKKEFNDGALPSGNSVSALNLLRLYHLTFEPSYLKRAEELLSLIAGAAENYPAGFSQGLIAIDYQLGQPKEVVLVSDPNDPNLSPSLELFYKTFLPNKVLAWGEPASLEDQSRLAIFRGKTTFNNQLTFYICEDQTCKRPTTDLEEALKTTQTFSPSPPTPLP